MKDIFVPSLKLAQNIVSKHGTPVFVTDAETLHDRVAQFQKAFMGKAKIFYAIKANSSPHIVKVLKEAGIDGVDAVSPYEIELAKKCGFTSKEIIFTGNGSTDEELQAVMRHEVLCNIGSISELERFGRMFEGAQVSLRFNPGVGDGENKGVITAGQDSKFGIIERDFAIAKALLEKYQLKLKGLHCHIGSGFYDPDVFAKAVYHILEQSSHFEDLDFIDFGGGFGVRYQRDQQPIALEAFGAAIRDMVANFEKKNGHEVEIRFEPGKYLVAESTCLLSKITTTKSTLTKEFVCLDTGFHHLIRPALYGSSHQVINLSRTEGKHIKAEVVGNVCESTDIFASNVDIVDPKEGDIVALVSSGAYGSSMSSLYNLRPYATEVIVNGDEIELTRKKLTFEQMYDGLGYMPL